jgi:hypothetical protein
LPVLEVLLELEPEFELPLPLPPPLLPLLDAAGLDGVLSVDGFAALPPSLEPLEAALPEPPLPLLLPLPLLPEPLVWAARLSVR